MPDKNNLKGKIEKFENHRKSLIQQSTLTIWVDKS